MTFTEDILARRSGATAFLGRRIRDLIVLAAGAALALPLIVPFA
ncbi:MULTISPECIES: hypothetical protein [Methylorubrum]|uniref:ABC transporter permease n=1 Tax=Methylorubrum suomiense TaxID=144191 RepID=A0ABQ4UMZ8_9HYPH|nr:MULTISPECIES: hypothetical protein [Methylobacteriaceae]GJE73506.1 hypothetical protein BGCPKDLD_0070 [Methylorubrum suomiense]